jgi:hexosaminidase
MKTGNVVSFAGRCVCAAAIVPLGLLLVAGGRALAADAPPLKVMPLPRSVQRGEGVLVVTPASGLSSFTVALPGADARLADATHRMLEELDRTCGGDVMRSALAVPPGSAAGTLTITVAGPGEAVQSVGEDESYKLSVTSAGATLTAPNDLGAMHGLETLLQLTTLEGGACVLPAVTIDDAPRFAWRGFMVDVSRHFEPIAEIKRTLDGMAMVKLNVFHWHLSDDQGFRAESKKFPKLTSVGSGGQFYTQEEMRDVVAYARARGIRVVPEFDMPGHSTSWILAYPEYGAAAATSLPVVFGIPQAELDPTNEKTLKFIDALVGEMGEIFPDAYFHIGGDEVEGKGWLANPRIVEFMKKKGFAKPDDLQAYFNQRLLVILTKHHKKMIGWDEILKPELPKDIVVESWRGEASLAAGAVQGYTGILAAPYYLDGEKTSEEMFLADPVPADTKLTAEQQKLILGGEAAMWAEQLHYKTIDSRVWPRTAAIAERFWSPQADRNVADMYRRLRLTSLELEDVGLTHISGPEVLRRNLAGELRPGALETFASVIEPVSFGERYDAQKTDGLTALDRLVDAVVADPPSRQQIAGEVDEVVVGAAIARGDGSGAAQQLRARFTGWQAAAPELVVWAARSPRLSDIGPRAMQLGELGEAGLEALDYLRTGTAAPAAWTTAQLALLVEAKKPSALVRFTFLPALQRLVEAAGR